MHIPIGQTPALDVMLSLADREGRVAIRWADGEEILVDLDTFLEADETETGTEAWDVTVLEVRQPGTRGFLTGAYWGITSEDPPTVVMSPDGANVWRTGEPLPSREATR